MHELFEREYIKCEKALFLVAIGYLHNTEDARDAVQDAVLSAYQSFSSLKNIAYFKTWLTRIVINKCKDMLRKRKYSDEFVQAAILTDGMNAFCDMAEYDIDLMEAVCCLPPDTAKYITMRFYSDLTYEETAKILHRPVSTVKYRTAKALEELKKILEGDTTE